MNKADFEDWGPYLSYGKDSATEMRIAWKSRYFSTHHYIEWGKTKDCINKIEEDFVWPTRIHMFVLKNLKPQTKYFYKISRVGDESRIFSFTTGIKFGKKSKFEVTITGDIHADPSSNVRRVFDSMLKYRPDHDFNVAIGDSINDGSNPSHWNSYFSDLDEYLALRPQLNTTGNHDTGKSEDKYARFLHAFCHHPYEEPQKGGYYLVKYGNAVFFFIDSCNAGGWEPTPSDEQYKWLEENLQKYAKKNAWIFLFMHHQIYSTGDFSCNHVMDSLYRYLCREYEVDAVFYGHDHHYECFWVDQDMEYGGTLYFVSGGGGSQKRIDHSIMGDREGKTKYVWPNRVLNVRKSGVPPRSENITGSAEGFRNDILVEKSQLLGVLEPNFVSLELDGDQMDMRSIGWHGEIYHHLTVKRTGAGRKFDEKSEKCLYPPSSQK